MEKTDRFVDRWAPLIHALHIHEQQLINNTVTFILTRQEISIMEINHKNK